ncbi:hypothetical protein JW865_00280 [Candidatus Bathyarchaeota archaeon]|nr:hypothetical protein [Candidatus Bathyarchaeota archaeon]
MVESNLSKSFSDIDYNFICDCADLFTVFSNIDALRIFMYAEKGIPNSTVAIKELNLTPKRYYSRLKELLDCGLVVKNDEGYNYTPLGEVVAKMGLTLIEIMKNKEKIELIMNLSGSAVLSSDEKNKVNNFLLENFEVGQVIAPIINGPTHSKMERLSTYDELVKRICDEIELVNKNMFFASTYFDPIVSDKTVEAMNKGIPSKVMMSKKTMSKKITKLRMLLAPQSVLKLLDNMRKNPDLANFYREAEFPFSFLILDEEKCFFELPNIIDGEFTIAFFLEDKNVSQRFITLFNNLFNSADMGTLEIINVLKNI